MRVQLKPWGNSTGLRLPKEVLHRAGVKQDDELLAEVEDGRIVLTPLFRHQSIAVRAAHYGGELRLSKEMPRDKARGNEVW